jgi:hypothetical protein
MIWWHTWRMGIFNRTVNKAAISPQPTKAAAAGGTFYQNNNAGSQLVGQYYSYVEGTARNRAMSVPTISRARDLMASVIGCMSLKQCIPKCGTATKWKKYRYGAAHLVATH